MYAINHAATALILKKRYPAANMIWLLVAVQFIELLWVLFNLVGIEKGFHNRALGIAIGVGIFSHIVLDLLMHEPDIALHL